MRKILFRSVTAIMFLLGAAQAASFSYQAYGGFEEGAEVGQVDFNPWFDGTQGTLDGKTVWTEIYWGTQGGANSHLELVPASGTIEDDGSLVPFGSLIHYNQPIASGTSLLDTRVIWHMNIDGVSNDLNRTWTFNLYNWETPNSMVPCPRVDPIQPVIRPVDNGVPSHPFVGDNPGGTEGSCSDAHNFGVAIDQNDTWVDGPSAYKIQFSGFFSDTTPPVLTGTFWSIEGGNTTGYVGVSITLIGPSTASVGNFVWQDYNNNGIQDAGEPGAPNVTVELYEAGATTPYATTMTDASGAYVFNNVPTYVTGNPNPLEYFIKFIPPADPGNFKFSDQQNPGDPKASATDSDADQTTGETALFTLDDNNTNFDIDAGIMIGAIGDYVWFDANENGIQDDGEGGIPDATVNLYKNGDLFDTQQTDPNGAYLFAPLGEGDYFVEFILRTSLQFTGKNVGGDSTIDSDADETTGRTDTITITLGNSSVSRFLDWDAGMYIQLVPEPSIVIEKSTNDRDADTAPGPFIIVGSPVEWLYIVANDGNVPLYDITVTDDQGVTVTCPETTLDPGTFMTCTATGTAVEGQYQNIGTVTATTGESTTEPTTVTASDVSHYFGQLPPVENPSISISKSTNGDRADTVPGIEVLVGESVTWSYVVENNGDVTMENIVVTDDQEGVITCPETTLAPGEIMECTFSGIAIEGQYTNVGSVTANDPTGAQYDDSDTSNYMGVGECPCDDVESDSSSALNTLSAGLMIVMTVMIGLFFVRREEQLHPNER